MTAYYNEFDKRAAAWLRELIREGLLPHGEVDERDIREVKPSDLRGFVQCHFFAGIGGWPYALRLAGWPEKRKVWTGSPPCQDNSLAISIHRRRAGLRGERSGLALVWLDLVSAELPSVLFFENVPGLKRWKSEITARLAGAGYCLFESERTAIGVGAPHLRRRLWLAADRGGERRPRRRKARSQPHKRAPWPAPPRDIWRANLIDFSRMAYGLSGRMGKVRGYGNAIVPQVAAEFIGAYLEARALT